MTIDIKINGTVQQVRTGSSVLDFLTSRSIEPSHVVVELNGSVLDRAQYGDAVLEEGDSVEVLRFVGGG
ncbi:MAG: sulfur carrier protein ThiS [Chitinispirillaceae bacterium]